MYLERDNVTDRLQKSVYIYTCVITGTDTGPSCHNPVESRLIPLESSRFRFHSTGIQQIPVESGGIQRNGCIPAGICGASKSTAAVIQSIEPLCGLCLCPSQLCQFYLAKGKGTNGNLRINQKMSKGCLMMMKYSYGIAAESTTSSPCSNMPIHCPICPNADPAIWKYFMRIHFEERHKTLDITKYKYL